MPKVEITTIRAKVLLFDKPEMCLYLTLLYGGGMIKTAYHLLLKVLGGDFGIEDFVIHKKDLGPEWNNIPSCAFLDILGDLNKQGLLLEIVEVDGA